MLCTLSISSDPCHLSTTAPSPTTSHRQSEASSIRLSQPHLDGGGSPSPVRAILAPQALLIQPDGARSVYVIPCSFGLLFFSCAGSMHLSASCHCWFQQVKKPTIVTSGLTFHSQNVNSDHNDGSLILWRIPNGFLRALFTWRITILLAFVFVWGRNPGLLS